MDRGNSVSVLSLDQSVLEVSTVVNKCRSEAWGDWRQEATWVGRARFRRRKPVETNEVSGSRLNVR